MTTVGQKEQKAVDALDAFVNALSEVKDPAERYSEAVEAGARWGTDVHDKFAVVREAALLELHESEGLSFAEIGRRFGFTRCPGARAGDASCGSPTPAPRRLKTQST